MNRNRTITHILAIATLLIAFAPAAFAQASRTWVSGVGDDVNPCSRTAPCKTFAGAISKTAAGGEINALDPGGFGAVTITKAITIDGGEGQIAGVLVSGTNGIVVQAGPNDVVALRNLDIDGLGTGINGIRFLSGKALHVDHCQIYGFTNNGIDDLFSVAQGGVAKLFVNDCFIRNNSANGIGVSGSGTPTEAVIDNCRIEGNGGAGVSASNGNAIDVVHSDISRNTGDGVKIDTGSSAFVLGCILNGNSGAGVVDNGAQFLLSDSGIFNNSGGGASGPVSSFGNNSVSGNGGGNTITTKITQQ